MSSANPTARFSSLVPQPFGPRWLRAWLSRHQHPINFYLHMIGIPLTILALPALLLLEWAWMLGLFIGGYLLQFLGHGIEGSEIGELMLLKRWLFRSAPPMAANAAAHRE
jgi:hypothetical protein